MIENTMVSGIGVYEVNSPLKEATVIGECECCGEDIVLGYEAFTFEGEYYCSKDCFCEHMGLKEFE